MKGVRHINRKKNNFVEHALILVVVCLIALAVTTGILSYASLYDENLNTIYQQNRALVNRLEGWMALVSNQVENNAMLMRDASVDMDTMIRYFGIQTERMDEVSLAFAGFPDGNIVFGGGWIGSGEVDTQTREWYLAAAETPGQVAFSRPYMGAHTGQVSFAAARTIGDHDTSRGVAVLSLSFEQMISYIEQSNGPAYSYSFILDENGDILFHPEPAYALLDDLSYQNIADVEGGRFESMFGAIRSEGVYLGGSIIYVGAPLEATNWYIITRIPTGHVMGNTMPTIFSLLVTALIALVTLIGSWFMLRKVRIAAKSEQEANEINKVFIRSAPFVMNIWDDKLKMIQTNDCSVEMFELADKQEYINRFYELSPEFQPCGRPSSALVEENNSNALESDDPVKFDWMHQTLDGRPIPTEVTLVRFKRNDRYYLASYTVDMRKIHEAMRKEREASELNEIFLDVSPFALDVWDEDFNLVDCNRQTLELFGLSSKDEYIRRFSELELETQPCGTPSAQMTHQYMQMAMDTGRSRFEYFHKTLDGVPLPTDITVVRVARGGKYMLVAFIIDLRPLREAEERNQVVLDSTPLAVSIYDKNLSAVTCNQEALRMFKLTEPLKNVSETVAGITMPTFQPNGRDSKELLDGWIAKALEEGRCHAEFISMRSDGSLFPSEADWVRIKFDDHYVVVEYLRDLTAEKEAGRREREANELVNIIMERAPLCIEMWDAAGELVYCNQQMLDASGAASFEEYKERFDELYSENQPDGYHSGERLAEMLETTMWEGSDRFEWTRSNAYGEAVPYDSQFVRISRGDKNMVLGYSHDLRQIQNAMAKVYESDQRAALMMSATPISCFMMRLIEQEDGRPGFAPIDFNHAAIELFGFSSRAEAFERFFEIFDAETKDIMVEDLIQINASIAIERGYDQFEFTHRSLTGELIPCEVTLVRVEYQDQMALVCFQSDLRPFRAVIEKERNARALTQTFLDAAPLFVEIWDDQLNLVECNQPTAAAFGLARKEDYIARYEEFSPKLQPCGTPSLEKARKMAEAAFKYGSSRSEWTHLDRNNQPFPVECTCVRLKRGDDDIVVVYNQDQRAVKTAMAKERKARESIQNFLDAAPTFIEIWDKNLNLTGCNKPTIDIFKVADEAEYIAKFSQLSPEFQPDGQLSSKKIRDMVTKCFREGYSSDEWMHIDIHGELLPVDVTYVRLMREDEEIVVGYNQDLRQIKAALAERMDAEAESQAKSQFLARMSHEVRTPMNSILGISEIELQKDIHPSETTEAFQRIFNSSQLLLSIINDILDLSKVEAGKMEIVPALYDTSSLIFDTVQLNLMYIGSKRIEFRLEVDERLPRQLIGDELRIKQVLNNIVSNAFKYTPEGDVTLTFGIDDEQDNDRTDEVSLCIKVADTGQGMSSEQLDKLFGNEYTRFNLESNRDIEGSGLGMVIAYSLIKMMGGEITAQSEPEKGSVFTLRIPQQKGGQDLLGSKAAARLQDLKDTKSNLKRTAHRDHEPMPYGRVLVVDDVESNLYVVKGFLAPYKLNVDAVESGFEAVARIKAGNEYDIVFMDHMMPKMDGIETTKILRDMGYIGPIIALTANATVGISKMFLDNGFSGFISKPFDPVKMDDCLKRYIRDRQPKEVIAAARADITARSNKQDEQAYDRRRNHSQDRRGLPDRRKYEKEKEVKLSERLIASFLIDAQKSIDVIGPIIQMENLNDEALKNYAIQTHAVKSALLNIGRTGSAEFARVLEDAGRAGDIRLIKSRTPQLLEEVREIADSLSARKEETADHSEDPAAVRSQLLAISAACIEYEITDVQERVAALKQLPLSRQTQQLIDKIERHLLLSDYTDAALLAKQAADKMLG